MELDDRDAGREIAAFLGRVDFTRGPVVAVAQDGISREVRMTGWMSRDALEATLRTGIAHYYSRSRDQIWKKGSTTGNVQMVRRIWLDCDGESVILEIEQVGDVTCHRGTRTCFTHGVGLEVAPDADAPTPYPVVPVTVGAPSRGQGRLLQQPLDSLALETHVRPLLAAYQSLLRIDSGESPFDLPTGADRSMTIPKLVESLGKLSDAIEAEAGSAPLVSLAAHVWSWGALCLLLDETGEGDAPSLAAAIAQGYFAYGSTLADVRAALNRAAAALADDAGRCDLGGVVTSALQAAGQLMKVLDLRPYAFLEHDRREMLMRPHLGTDLELGPASGVSPVDSYIHRPVP